MASAADRERAIKGALALAVTALAGVIACSGDSAAVKPIQAKPRVAPAAPAKVASAKQAGVSGGAQPPGPVELVVADVGFMTPESVLHDPISDTYLVSNIEGAPNEEDGNGFISRLSPDGEVLALKWIDGFEDGVTLDAPKGMAIAGDLLYVADITRVRTFDRRAGTPVGAIEVPGAAFLNDLAAAPEGGVFVSDSVAGAVHRIDTAGVVKVVAKSDALGGPNGLLVDADSGALIVASGKGTVTRLGKDGASTQPGPFTAPKAALDGVVRAPDGALLISSWEARGVYRVSTTGEFTMAIPDLEAPADIGLDEKRGRLLIPLFTANRVIIKTL